MRRDSRSSTMLKTARPPLDKGGLQAGWVIATRKVPPDVLCVRRGKTLLLKEQPCAS